MDNYPLALKNWEVEQKDLINVAMVGVQATLIALAYALPALLSGWWRQRDQERIARLNLLFGWTVIGWLILLGRVVVTRIKGSRGPAWRYRSRGQATTEHQRAVAGAPSVQP